MPLLWKKSYVFPSYTFSSCPVELGPHKSVRNCIIRILMTKIWFLSSSCCEYFKTESSCAADSWHCRFSVCQNKCTLNLPMYTEVKVWDVMGGLLLWCSVKEMQEHCWSSCSFPLTLHPLPEETSHWSVGSTADGGNSASSKTQRVQVMLQEGPWLLSFLQWAETCSLCCSTQDWQMCVVGLIHSKHKGEGTF